MKGLRWRSTVVFASIVFALYLLTPTYLKFAKGRAIPKTPTAEDPWYYNVLPSEALKLGLDLMGGLHLVLGLDFEEVRRDAVVKWKNQMKEMVEFEKIQGVSFETTKDDRIILKFPDEATSKKVDEMVLRNWGDKVEFESQDKTSAVLKMSPTFDSEIKGHALDQSLETLRNRIDEFGIAEPIIQRQGDEKILVQFPGVQDPGRLKDNIARAAKLTFQIVRTGPEVSDPALDHEKLESLVAEFNKTKNQRPDLPNQPISKYLRDLNDWLGNKIPAGTEVLFHREMDVNTKEARYIPYLLNREALVAGEDLADARYSFDPKEEIPLVLFQMNPNGANKFEKATGENVGKYMAIVLDSNVHSAPVINEKIPGGNAQITMKRDPTRDVESVVKDANDTARVLRSGALPARLEFLEERVVGPSLGADAIREGTRALAAGVAMVFAFLFLYYRTSGLVANLALAMNTLFTLAILSAFEGTLTLPGLAGMTLSLGMSVDANVLIFEHMRDEIRRGKSLVLAVGESYTSAMSAIFDSNVTVVIAGLVLLQFGYGPIRGFAVTLLIGVIASMYTAVFCTRVVFDYFVVSKHRTSIGL